MIQITQKCSNKLFICSIITYIYFHYLGLLQSLIPFIRCRRDRVLGAGGMDFDVKREYKVRHSHTINMFHILFSFISYENQELVLMMTMFLLIILRLIYVDQLWNKIIIIHIACQLNMLFVYIYHSRQKVALVSMF